MYRTDLAIERKEIISAEFGQSSEIRGVSVDKSSYGDDVTSTTITIEDNEGSMRMKKPVGKYITIESAGLLDEENNVKENLINAVAGELKKLVVFHYNLKVLVVGLGNIGVTPDSLGPKTISKIRVTGHLFTMFGAEGDEDMSNVCCISPGVTAMTGMETADFIKKTVELVKPEILIVIDSLAARSIERVSTTIQITDTGISPGAGMGNKRKGITEETVGAKVIAIGVPTVIDVTTIVRDALTDNIQNIEQVEEYIETYNQNMIVTSTDIDMLTNVFSDIIATGVNITLHPGIYY